jgi:hypothetical protein
MTFQAPTLETYLSTDTDYVTKWNTNVSRITDAFNSIEADLAASIQGTSLQLSNDWYRRASASDPLNGVVGAHSFEFSDIGSNQFSLLASAQDGVSVAVISGTRRQHTGDLTGTLSTLGLSDASYTIYVGVDASGTSDLSLGFSTAQSDIDLVLYELDVTVSGTGTTYTIDDVKRAARTLLWDNTVEQLRQEVPYTITTSFEDVATGAIASIRVPCDSTIKGLWMSFEDNVGSVVMQLRDFADTPENYVSYSADPGGAGVLAYQAVAAAYADIVFAAGTQLVLDLQTIGATTGKMVIGVELIPAYNVPTH